MHVEEDDGSSPEMLCGTDLLKGHLGRDTRLEFRRNVSRERHPLV